MVITAAYRRKYYVAAIPAKDNQAEVGDGFAHELTGALLLSDALVDECMHYEDHVRCATARRTMPAYTTDNYLNFFERRQRANKLRKKRKSKQDARYLAARRRWGNAQLTLAQAVPSFHPAAELNARFSGCN